MIAASDSTNPPQAPSWGEELGRRAPNALTLLRIFLVPLFVFLLVNPTPTGNLWATGIFIVASITDWLDGYLARIYQAESIFGTLFDPLADKILVMAALVMLCAVPQEPRVPAWIVVVLLSREMVVGALRSLAAVRGIVVPASRWAKHKTAWTMLALSCLLINEPYEPFGILVNFHLSGMVFLWLALIFSITTGLGYGVALRDFFSPITKE